MPRVVTSILKWGGFALAAMVALLWFSDLPRVEAMLIILAVWLGYLNHLAIEATNENAKRILAGQESVRASIDAILSSLCARESDEGLRKLAEGWKKYLSEPQNPGDR